MRDRSAAWVAEKAGARLVAGDARAHGPRRAVVDSRHVRPGDLFLGLRGERADGGEWASDALAAGAWGVLVDPEHTDRLHTRGRDAVLLSAADPLAALASLARAWRRELACPVVGVTGSTGKTSTKDILSALLRPSRRTHANRENLNTEVGLPLSVLEAERHTEILVLEMAMRGEGQIAELARIAEPSVGVVVNVGPVHLELLGTVERVARAKAELIRGLPQGAACIVPAGERLLAEHLREDLRTITFGPGGDVSLRALRGRRAEIDLGGTVAVIELSYSEPYNILNTLAAVAAVHALEAPLPDRVEVGFSSLRGEVVELPGGVTVVNDCYNANPMSMSAALEHLAGAPAARRLAVLGTMAELGPDSERFHREIGERARSLGIDALITVGERALAYLSGYDGPSYPVACPEEAGALLGEIASRGDRVLVKGSRSAGLERVLASGRGRAAGPGAPAQGRSSTAVTG